MKVLITPRGFANYGTDIVKEMEAKGVTVHYNAVSYTHLTLLTN